MNPSTSWKVTEPTAWVLLQLRFPTTMNMLEITWADEACDEFAIEMETLQNYLKPDVLNVNEAKYWIFGNKIKLESLKKKTKVKLKEVEGTTGIRLDFPGNSICQIEEVSLGLNPESDKAWDSLTNSGFLSSYWLRTIKSLPF